jgi:alkanesulfonate monooxygenase SsuD/methylene tetrahydromethanopterin reductase-like flavin-dependent oxidoreductase (luciferase family)
MADLELAATIGGSAEELGYTSVWTNDAHPGDGISVALSMLSATQAIRVGIGAVPLDRRGPRDIAARLDAGSVPLDRLVLVVGSGASRSLDDVRSGVSELRDLIDPEVSIGVAAMGPNMCRLGGEIADLVLLNWMNPEHIRWACDQIRSGAEKRQEGLRAPEPEVASYIRVGVGQGAALRVGAEAARYGAMPQYARNFEAMHSASVGIAASDPAHAKALIEPYLPVLDEAILRPIVKMPAGASPELGDVFEALGVIMEVASLFAPRPAQEG